MTSRDPEPRHRFERVPGAYCVVCGAPDRREACLAAEHEDGCGRVECVNRPCPGPPRGLGTAGAVTPDACGCLGGDYMP